MKLTTSEIDTVPDEIKDTPLERFGLQLRLRRKTAGYNPMEFASKVGMDIETLAAVEFGYAPLKVVCLNLDPIASGLGISAAALRVFLNNLYIDLPRL